MALPIPTYVVVGHITYDEHVSIFLLATRNITRHVVLRITGPHLCIMATLLFPHPSDLLAMVISPLVDPVLNNKTERLTWSVSHPAYDA